MAPAPARSVSRAAGYESEVSSERARHYKRAFGAEPAFRLMDLAN